MMLFVLALLLIDYFVAVSTLQAFVVESSFNGRIQDRAVAGSSSPSIIPHYAYLNHRRSVNDGSKIIENITQLEAEVNTFLDWMAEFSAPESTFKPDKSGLKSQVQTHMTAVKSFITNTNSKSTLSAVSLHQLEGQTSTFKAWTDTWYDNIGLSEPASSLYFLRQEISLYKAWMRQWISINRGMTSSSFGLGQPSSTSKSGGVSSRLSSLTTTAQSSERSTVAISRAMSSSNPSILPTSVHSSLAPTDVTTKQPENQPSATELPKSIISNVFNANAATNLATWWGQTDETKNHGLDELCNSSSYDIVIISFITQVIGPGGYPTLNLGSAAGAPSSDQTAAGATGLLDATSLSPVIKNCQSRGKKVFISVGGTNAQVSFASDTEGDKFAGVLWNLFLGGNSTLRPFGDVQLDGIDIDNESKNQTGYVAFTSALREKMKASNKRYYISAAPQCPQPDASIPLEAMKQMDFIWVQFYNNGNCNHGADGFFSSVETWSQNINNGTYPKLYIAAIAHKSQGTGFIDSKALLQEVIDIRKRKLTNFGGYALWDGSYAIANGRMDSVIKQGLIA